MYVRSFLYAENLPESDEGVIGPQPGHDYQDAAETGDVRLRNPDRPGTGPAFGFQAFENSRGSGSGGKPQGWSVGELPAAGQGGFPVRRSHAVGSGRLAER